jgi:hypothetical protein
LHVSGGQINISSEYLEFKPVEGNLYAPDGAEVEASLYLKVPLSAYGAFLFKRALIRAGLGLRNSNENFSSGTFLFVSGHQRGVKVKLYNPERKQGSSFVITREKSVALRDALSARARYFSTEIPLEGEVLILNQMADGLIISYSGGGKLSLDLAEVYLLRKVVWKIMRGENASYQNLGELSLKLSPERLLFVNGNAFPLTKERAVELLSVL